MYDTAVRTQAEDSEATLNGIAPSDIRAALDHILNSRVFIQSRRIRRFLQFIVEESLLGQPHRLKEYPIGLEVFDRREAFDPRVDSIVRVEARRLRTKLEEYYRTEGHTDPIRILLRKGSYMPVFEHRDAAGIHQAPRRTVEIAPLTFLNPASNAGELAAEIQRRLAHVLIKDGGLQVAAQPQPGPFSSPTNGHSHSRHAPAADYVVESRLEFLDGYLHLMVQLFQNADGSYTWSEAVDFEPHDLRGVEQLAQSLVRALSAGTNQAMAARLHAEDKESRDFYLQGRYHWKLATPESIRNSVACFTQAVDSDMSYAAAWAALAQALIVSSMFGFLSPQATRTRAKDAAEKAVELNPLLPEAHVALGSALSLLDWDWVAGEQELQKAVQLDPHDPTGHLAYGLQLACRRRWDVALAAVEKALELDPAALFANFIVGWLYGVSGRHDEAIAQHKLVLQFAPDNGLPQFGLGLAYLGKGMFQDSIAHFTNANQLKCRWLIRGHLGYSYAMNGQRAEALQEMSTLDAQRGSHYVSPASFAAISVGLGEKDQALHYIEQALEDRDTFLAVNLLNPAFDSLGNESRFLEVRRKLGLV